MLSVKYKFNNPAQLLQNVEILDIQRPGKSQSALLSLLDEELQNTYRISLNECGTSTQKYALYFDDILATGGTVFKELHDWLKLTKQDGKTNLSQVVSGDIVLTVNLFCNHNANTTLWRLKMQLKEDKLLKNIK